jgi:hypothetical protein
MHLDYIHRSQQVNGYGLVNDNRRFGHMRILQGMHKKESVRKRVKEDRINPFSPTIP